MSAALVVLAVGAGEFALAATAGATTDPSTSTPGATPTALVLDSCATTATGAAGVPVALRQSAVSGPVTATIRAVPSDAPAAPKVQSAFDTLAPLPLGTIPHGRRVITGSELAGLVATELDRIPGLGLTPTRLDADVHSALDRRCAVTLTDAAPTPSPTTTTTTTTTTYDPPPSPTTRPSRTSTPPPPSPSKTRPTKTPTPTTRTPAPTTTTTPPSVLNGTPAPTTTTTAPPPKPVQGPKPPAGALPTGQSAPPFPAPGTPPKFGPPSPSALPAAPLDIVRLQVVGRSFTELPGATVLPSGSESMLPPLISRESVPAPRPQSQPDTEQTSGDPNDISGPVTALPPLATAGLGGWTAFAVIWMTVVVTLRIRSWHHRHGTGR